MLKSMIDLVMRLRNRLPQKPAPLSLLGVNSFLDDDPVLEPAEAREIHRRLAAMPIMVREIYLLRMVDGLPIDRIAERLALPRRKVIESMAKAVELLMRR